MKISSLLFLLIFCLSCAHYHPSGDKKISQEEAPEFLLRALPQDQKLKGLKFYSKKQDQGLKIYEAKYLLSGQEVSLKMDEEGRFIEKEEDLDFEDLESSLRLKLKAYFQHRFKGHEILEVERRVDENRRVFIDVELATSEAQKPFIEISFDETGAYVSEKIESVETIRTLR
jgi:hypothetical protein